MRPYLSLRAEVHSITPLRRREWPQPRQVSVQASVQVSIRLGDSAQLLFLVTSHGDNICGARWCHYALFLQSASLGAWSKPAEATDCHLQRWHWTWGHEQAGWPSSPPIHTRLCFFSFFKDFIYLFLEREEGGGEREGEKHRSPASHMRLNLGPNPQPRHVP